MIQMVMVSIQVDMPGSAKDNNDVGVNPGCDAR